MRNVHVAFRQHPEGITQRFSRRSKLIRVVPYCRRFINNCRHSKAKQTTTLSTQDLDQTLTCCVKMVQQISYTQEMKRLDGTTWSCIYQFNQDTTSIHWSGRSSQSSRTTTSLLFLIGQCIRWFCPQIIILQNWLSQQHTYDFIMLGHNFWLYHYVKNIGY